MRVGRVSQAPDEAAVEAKALSALATNEKTLGPDHPTVATGCSNLGLFYYYCERLPEAKPMMERALAIFTAALGPEHPDTKNAAQGLEMVEQASRVLT